MLIILGLQFIIPLPKVTQLKRRQLHAISQVAVYLLFYGDSTIKWSPPSDRIKAGTSHMLKDLLPFKIVISDVHESNHIGTYDLFIRHYLTHGFRTRYFVFPINIRSLGPEWDKHPLWQFEDNFAMLPLIHTVWIRYYKPLSVFKYAKQKYTFYDYHNLKVYKGEEYVGRVGEFYGDRFMTFSPENMRDKMIFRYMFPLKKGHQKLKTLKELMRFLKQYNVTPIIYSTPIDYQTGEKYCGEEFSHQLYKNVKLVEETLKEEGVPFLDLTMTLPTEYFSWHTDEPDPLYPNAHLTYKGRAFIAKNLHDFIKRYE